jgi:hypothetical protein
MPLLPYLITHLVAELSDKQKQVLKNLIEDNN